MTSATGDISIEDHDLHLKQLTVKAGSGKLEAIKELIDYLILAHASKYVHPSRL